jgi:hypothetical protein
MLATQIPEVRSHGVQLTVKQILSSLLKLLDTKSDSFLSSVILVLGIEILICDYNMLTGMVTILHSGTVKNIRDGLYIIFIIKFLLGYIHYTGGINSDNSD